MCPRGRVAAPLPRHTASLLMGVNGQRIATAELGGRGTAKSALPGMACSVPGNVVDTREGRGFSNLRRRFPPGVFRSGFGVGSARLLGLLDP